MYSGWESSFPCSQDLYFRTFCLCCFRHYGPHCSGLSYGPTAATWVIWWENCRELLYRVLWNHRNIPSPWVYHFFFIQNSFFFTWLFWILGHLVVLKSYYWCCTQGSHMAEFGKPHVVPGIGSALAMFKASGEHWLVFI